MKRGIYTICTICTLMLAATGAMAQSNVITADTNQTDSSTIDVQYLSSSVEGQYRLKQLEDLHISDTLAMTASRDTLAGHKIPTKLRRVLKKDEQYKGWESTGVHLDSDTNLYMVSVVQGNTFRTFGFNVYGKPVLVTEVFRKGNVLRADGGE